jgi:hypothetical protein
MIVSAGVRVCERKNELGAINPRLSTFRPGRPALTYADTPTRCYCAASVVSLDESAAKRPLE